MTTIKLLRNAALRLAEQGLYHDDLLARAAYLERLLSHQTKLANANPRNDAVGGCLVGMHSMDFGPANKTPAKDDDRG